MFLLIVYFCFIFSEPFQDGSYKNLHICPSLSSFTFTNWDSTDKVILTYFFYAPNFEEVEEAYWFGPVHPSVGHTLHTVKNG